jgi:hypothetical protein
MIKNIGTILFLEKGFASDNFLSIAFIIRPLHSCGPYANQNQRHQNHHAKSAGKQYTHRPVT